MNLYFSIICPVYNRELLVSKAIESVKSQTFQDWELIIVDDGSTDKTNEVVKNFILKDTRIKYYFQENKGQSSARNLGIKKATGKFICFLDSDDLYFVNHLFVIYNLINSNGKKSAIYCTRYYINNYKHEESIATYDGNSQHPVEYVLFNTVSSNSLSIPKSILINNNFDERWRYFEDTHLLIRLLLKYPLIQSEEYTCVLNNHSQRGTYTIYNEKNTIDKIENNISAIKDLFEKHGKEIIEITQKPYLREYLVSEKYIHHANGALIYGHPILSFQLILKAISSDKYLIHRRLYLRYFLKYPIYSLFYFFKKRL